jgi:hypothetical protein
MKTPLVQHRGTTGHCLSCLKVGWVGELWTNWKDDTSCVLVLAFETPMPFGAAKKFIGRKLARQQFVQKWNSSAGFRTRLKLPTSRLAYRWIGAAKALSLPNSRIAALRQCGTPLKMSLCSAVRSHHSALDRQQVMQ